MHDSKALIEALLPVVAQAGQAIMAIYDGDFAVQKKDDNSPLTLADLESQHIILQSLTLLTPQIPVLSEESAQAPWAQRKSCRSGFGTAAAARSASGAIASRAARSRAAGTSTTGRSGPTGPRTSS